MDFLLDLYL